MTLDPLSVPFICPEDKVVARPVEGNRPRDVFCAEAE